MIFEKDTYDCYILHTSSTPVWCLVSPCMCYQDIFYICVSHLPHDSHLLYDTLENGAEGDCVKARTTIQHKAIRQSSSNLPAGQIA